ncbi:uncharacterized protein [Pyxicephalus adspersus]|uniref:uncharacterized protein n=1 Tax=Pyxicephalus adspersus TaxID=30357 RepID=UPI003B5A1528
MDTAGSGAVSRGRSLRGREETERQEEISGSRTAPGRDVIRQHPEAGEEESRDVGLLTEDGSEGELSGSEASVVGGLVGGAAAEGPSSFRQPGELPCLIWILGHSFVYWGARWADMRLNGQQLGLSRDEAKICWIGIPGKQWRRVVPEVYRFASLDRPPNVLLIHAGGNDLGVWSMRELMRDIKFDWLRLREAFPGMVLLWSDIVARLSWRHARSLEKLNRARVKVNKEVGRFLVKIGGLVVRHWELESEPRLILRGDGVHLNAVGTDLWLLSLQEGVHRALRVWRRAQT